MTTKKVYSKKALEGQKYTGTWLEPATYKAVKLLADKDDRSVAAFIKKVLEKTVAESTTA